MRVLQAQQHVGAPIYGSNHLRQRQNGSRNTIQLAPAVVRYHDCRCALIERASCIFSSENTFHDDRTWPEFANPAKIVPSDGCGGETGTDIH